jgi:hypothetical protein
MPVGLFHGTSGNANTCIGSSRTIGALLTCGRIVAFQNLLDDKPDMLRVASVAQEKCFLTVANEDERVVWYMRSWFWGHFDDNSIGCRDNVLDYRVVSLDSEEHAVKKSLERMACLSR